MWKKKRDTDVLHVRAIAAALLLSVSVSAQAEEARSASDLVFTGDNERVRMYMVRRLYDFTKDIAGIRAANEPGHQAHLLQFGQSVVSSALLDDDGTRIGSLSISNLDSAEETNSYVYDDPFTQGGIYKEITIAPAPVMYFIRKDYADRDTVERVVAQHSDSHFDHLSTHGRNVVSASIKDDAGNSVSSLAIGAYNSWDDVVHFVYQDPYTQAGMFRAITIETVDLYKLDGSFERAPAWFYDEMKSRQLTAAIQ